MCVPKGNTQQTEDKNMWTQGAIGIKDENGRMVSISYWVKHFEEESQFGIDNGRISKLMLKQDGKVVYNYDRGEDTNQH